MLQNDGEFLIRDSRSSLGDYVLSCHWGGQALHFKIIRVVLRPRKGYSRTLFQFEQEQFDNVPALVRFYVGNRKIISDISGAVVSRPVNRNVPLRCLKERFSDTGRPPGALKEEEAPLRRFSFRSATAGEQIGDGNFNLLTGSDPVLRASASASHLLEGLGLSGSEGRLHSKAPPKPLRAPSMLMSDYCELVPKVPQGWRGRSEETEEEPGFERPLLETVSSFQLQHFNSLLLTPNNKPLDPGTLQHLKDIFATHDCHTTALHVLKMDCQALRIIGVSKEQQRAMGVSSGLELITLPQGHQFRKDLLERHHLIALGIAVDILGCTGSVAERAATLHKIIQLAVELWRPVGDLFAFSAVMKALQLPQITRLEQTWRHLRQSHTASAIVYEKKLKPLLGNLNRAEGREVAVPHILPLLSLMEGEQLWDDNEETCDVLLRTLEAARFVATNTGAYRIRAEARLQGRSTPELLEAFQTEFSLRLFWGSKGAQAERGERYKKFERILTVLSQKLE
uniref:Breast cancer anti-estrogen resistance protein 3-like n=1 Tax=Pseudonaja textilis TaxID=8673 RepID=A0A670ZYB9_PSETE